MDIVEAKKYIAQGVPADNAGDIMQFHELHRRVDKAKRGIADACPFCGKSEWTLTNIRNVDMLAVECGDCGGQGPLADTEEDAIFRWNEAAR